MSSGPISRYESSTNRERATENPRDATGQHLGDDEINKKAISGIEHGCNRILIKRFLILGTLSRPRGELSHDEVRDRQLKGQWNARNPLSRKN